MTNQLRFNPMYWLAIAFTISTILLDVKIAFAQQDPKPGLEFASSLDKSRYEMGEPVYLTVVLSNKTGAAIPTAPILSVQDGTVQVTVLEASGRSVIFVPTSILDSDAPPVPLPPGGSIANVMPIFFGARGWTFETPGSYAIDASYLHGNGADTFRVSAPRITVEIADSATGKILLQGPKRPTLEAGKFLVWMGGDHLRGGLMLLEEVMLSDPTSPIASHAALALGKSLTRHFKDYGTDRVRPPNYKRAKSYLDRVRPTDLPTYLRAQLDIAQAMVRADAGQLESARVHLDRAKRVIRERPELAMLADVAERTERIIKR